MRILQLGKFYPIRGGVEKVMRDLTEGLSGRGVDCDMLCAVLPSSGIDPKDRDKVSREKGVTLIQLNPHGRIIGVKAVTKLAGTMLAPAMIPYLRAHKDQYDMVHVHHPDPMAALALWLSGYKGPVVLHWHSDILSQKGLLALYRPLQRWLIRRACAIVGTTPVYLKASPYLRDCQEKCTCVPIGIPPFPADAEAAATLRKSYPCRYLLLSVGRLVPYKGFRYLIEAMGLLPPEFELVLVGDGPLKEELQQQVRSLGLENRVHMMGFMEEGEAFNALFGACDVFVLPSVMKTEAFGIVQIEAMSCGKPVVATAIPGSGVSWVNREGVSGRNARPEDPASLAEAIRSVCADKDRFGEGAKALFGERYRIDKMIDKTLELYEKISK